MKSKHLLEIISKNYHFNWSNSEKHRLLTSQKGAVLVNGKPLGLEDCNEEIESVVLFPNGNKITLF